MFDAIKSITKSFFNIFLVNSYNATTPKDKEGFSLMKIVVYRSPKFLSKILYKLFGMK